MPDVNSYSTEAEWMEACVPAALDEGRAQDQAVAMCLTMWREKAGTGGEVDKAATHRAIASRALRELLSLLEDRTIPAALRAELEGARDALRQTWADLEAQAQEVADMAAGKTAEVDAELTGAVELPMLMTKAEKMADGRIRWQARANTGKKDLEGERFDVSFWDDVTHNFSRAQEAVTRSEAPPDGMPVPILDVAHYSFRLPADKRNLARAGYPIKLWIDGTALMAQGYFDDTPLGRAAAMAATKRPVSERRVSVGVWPDWGRVELDEGGHRIYKGGRNRAYLDHLAITAHPIDPGTVLEVKSMTQKRDALDVLGEEAAPLVDEIEAAMTKAAPDGVVVKAEEPAPEAKAEDKPAEDKADEKPAGHAITLDQLQDLLSKLFETFKSELDDRLGPVEAAVGDIAGMKARIDALGATETAKVKAAIDSGGNWWEHLVKASVQRRAPVEDKGPEQKPDPSDPFYRMFGGLKSP